MSCIVFVNVSAAFRIFAKHPLHTLLNMLGLATGLAASLFILLFVRYELSYDRWLAGSENLYALETQFTIPGRAQKTLARTPLEVKDALLANFSEIRDATRIDEGELTVIRGPNQFTEPVAQVEANFFDMFPLRFLEGDASLALSENNSIVISQSLRRKHFGEGRALGETLSVAGFDLTVTGVVADIPDASHLNFSAFLYLNDQQLDNNFIDWSSTRVYTYVRLADGIDPAELETRFPAFLDKTADFAPETMKALRPSSVMGLSLLPFKDVHLYGRGENPITPGGSAETVYAFIGVAVLLLAIAIINYVNLTTAKSAEKIRGIAMRKILGASRRRLILQNLGESIIMALLACNIALTVAEAGGDRFFALVGIDPAAATLDMTFTVAALLISILVGIAAGLYPALYLSSVPPAHALSAHDPKSKGSGLRQALVLVQFSASIGLIVIATLFYFQTRFAMQMDLGFDQSRLVIFRNAGSPEVGAVRDTLKAEFDRIPGIAGSSFSSLVPGDQRQNNVTLTPTDGGSATFVAAFSIDPDFFDVYRMRPLAGRMLDTARVGDRLTVPEDDSSPALTPIVISATAVRALGFSSPADAIGGQFSLTDFASAAIPVEVIGVVGDAHFRSIHTAVPPSLYFYFPPYTSALTVRLEGLNQAATLDRLDEVWSEIVPGQQLSREFLADNLAAQYTQESRRVLIFGAFAGLTILVACLGIFGLAAYAVEARTKEVGLRKVLGASVQDIISLFIWQFSKPVLLANLLALPVAAYLVSDWLDSFAYRIDLTPWPFLAAGLAALMIAWATVSTHAFRIARANPVHALRYE